MKVYYKDKKKFKNKIFISGFNFNSLSLRLEKSRQYIGKSLQNGTIGANSAKKICEILKVDYEELFEIR